VATDHIQRGDSLSASDPEATTTLGAWLARNSITLTIVAAAIAFAAWKGWDFVLIAKVILGLGFVVFIHELGHFLAAKWCDVHVETFSIGFGPALPGCSFRYGETRYMIALFPLGGYVKMVGEGSEGDEGDEDPRSFKNKPVGQRMLIISAGVIMNVALAVAIYIGVFMTTGAERIAGIVGMVDSGSPAWQEGLRSGAALVRVGNIDNPYFDIDLMPEVMHWSSAQPMPVHYVLDGKTVETSVTPKKFDATGRQMLGIGRPMSTRLLASNRQKLPPFFPKSPAASAEPSLKNDEVVVGTTDPDNPATTKMLPVDPRAHDPSRFDYWELARRLQRLAGREIILLVRPADASPTSEPRQVVVPPAFHCQTGLIMQMGPVAAIRRNSPADKAGIRGKESANEVGDIIDTVELPNADGKSIRYVSVRSALPDPRVEERLLDPVRLPFELRQWADSQPTGPKTLQLTLIRQVEHKERKEVRVAVTWDDAWKYSHSSPSGESSPQSIDELGLAYQVISVVKDVLLDSPAARAGIQSGDVVKSIGLLDADRSNEPEWTDVELTGWANTHWVLQQIGGDSRKIMFKYQRGAAAHEASLDCAVDSTWPLVERGFRFDYDTRSQRADGFAEAVSMGARDTLRQINVIYNNLFAMLTGKVSFKKNASGPPMIAAVAYQFAGRNFSEFILFLGMISVNLAVINFLPIPVLDGGHMVFLVYEKLRGRPAPEQFRMAATFVGVALIVSLMVFVTYLDFKKL
jgi:regulator of sigma E protease